MISTHKIQEMTITPQLAASWLAMEGKNRKMNIGLVNVYVRDMLADQWQLNGETIKRAVDGTLLDGQHRLHAIVRAGISVRMMVVSGLDADSFKTIDTGMRRTTAHLAGIAGMKNAATQASIGRWLVLLTDSASATRRSVTSQQVFDALEQHPLAGHFAMRNCEKRIKRLMPSACSAVMVLAAEKYGVEVPDSFMSAFSSGENMNRGDPAFELRERLIQNAARVAKLTTNTIVALTIKAVRAYATQRSVGVLRHSPGEGWPEL